jgi:hypothetical protein
MHFQKKSSLACLEELLVYTKGSEARQEATANSRGDKQNEASTIPQPKLVVSANAAKCIGPGATGPRLTKLSAGIHRNTPVSEAVEPGRGTV